MRIRTMERCPVCSQIVYMQPYTDPDDPNGIAQNIYLDQNGVLCVVMMSDDFPEPTYVCIHCGWTI